MGTPLQFVLKLGLCSLAFACQAEVRVYVTQDHGLAYLNYLCTEGEVVRAFALDVSVDQGRILGVSDFYRGLSTTATQGYGIFPASFRDRISKGMGTNVDWTVDGYTPLAVPSDFPADTLPGLGSSGVTLEFGALWNSSEPLAIPGPTGTLCALRISQGAVVSVVANESRGAVVAADPDMVLAPAFFDAVVQPPEVTGLAVENDTLTITFAGGALEVADDIAGPWTGVEGSGAIHTEPVSGKSNRFFRVRNP